MEWDHNAIKFYGVHDLGSGHHLRKVEEVLKRDDCEISCGTINDCLELYNVKKFIDAGLQFHEWTDATINAFADKCRKIPGAVGKFLATINDSNILDAYNVMNGVYEDDFWEATCEYKLYERISSEKLSELLSTQPRAIGYILKHKKIVLYHGKTLTEQLEANVHTAEMLMRHYLVAHKNDDTTSYFVCVR